MVLLHDDVIKWKHFPRNWPFVRGIHRSPVNSPHKGQWRAALMFTLICVWINGCVNNREAGNVRRYYAHYGVTVMACDLTQTSFWYAESIDSGVDGGTRCGFDNHWRCWWKHSWDHSNYKWWYGFDMTAFSTRHCWSNNQCVSITPSLLAWSNMLQIDRCWGRQWKLFQHLTVIPHCSVVSRLHITSAAIFDQVYRPF